MTKLLTSPWLTLPVGALVYLASTLLLWKTPALPPPPKGPEAAVLTGPSWEFSNPEADQLISQLRQREKDLDAREKKLQDWEQSLDTRRLELNVITQQVWQLQSEFDKAVVRVSDEETSNLKKLAKVYADMSPENAASVMAQLDDVVIVKIMLFMKESETAAILEAMVKQSPASSKRAAQISEHVRLSVTHNPPAK